LSYSASAFPGIRKRIELDDLPVEIRHSDMEPAVLQAEPSPKHRKQLTRQILLELLAECGWNKAEVGRRVGYSRTAIWKYMKKWEIPLQPGKGF